MNIETAVLLAILVALFIVWRVVKVVKHDRVWRPNKEGFYGDPYKQAGLEEGLED